MSQSNTKNISLGIGLAVLATLIWSGNFVVARAVNKSIPPIALNFYRWLIASVLILPFAWHQLRKAWPLIKKAPWYLRTCIG